MAVFEILESGKYETTSSKGWWTLSKVCETNLGRFGFIVADSMGRSRSPFVERLLSSKDYRIMNDMLPDHPAQDHHCPECGWIGCHAGNCPIVEKT